MIGLATMAAKLAYARNGFGYDLSTLDADAVVSRESAFANPAVYRASREYYRIIDRITDGLKPCE